ncbi:MAG: flagellar basal body rod protein FlgB [Chloroflexota bacterium]
MPELMNDITTQVLQNALSGLNKRQQVIGHNIANAETPGYQALAVNFENQLQRALTVNQNPTLERTDALHLATPAPRALGAQVDARQNSSMRLDGNNVDIDLEMSQLAETSIQYQSLTQLVSKKLALLKSIAIGR